MYGGLILEKHILDGIGEANLVVFGGNEDAGLDLFGMTIQKAAEWFLPSIAPIPIPTSSFLASPQSYGMVLFMTLRDSLCLGTTITLSLR